MDDLLLNILAKILKEYWDFNGEIELTLPPKLELGDRCFSCFSLARELKKSPQMIASELKEICQNNKEIGNICESFDIAGPYLNFTFSSQILSQKLLKIHEEKYNFLYSDLRLASPQKIVIDYIGANVGKPLHIGHMCTPNQGQVFINLFRKLGYDVIADSHIGDWGIIFGKLITAFQKYGDFDSLKENAVEHLFDLYVKISDDAKNDESLDEKFRLSFKLLSQGDESHVELWKKFTAASIVSMRNTLSRIFVKPDYDIGESFYEGIGLPKMQDYPNLSNSMSQIVEELIQKNIATVNDDGSVGVIFPEESKMPSCILRKRDGTHGYLASDLACVKYRIQNWSPEKIIYFVDVRQQLHLKQVFEIAKKAGWIASEYPIFHAFNGFISLKDGAMSTREGRIIKLDALFQEAHQRAKTILLQKRDDLGELELEKLAEIIGIAAIKYGYLKKSRESDVIFDWDEFMNFEGNSGPYIQYGYVRAQKILSGISFESLSQKISFSEGIEREFFTLLMTFSQVITQVLDGYHAHHLCQYMYEITKKMSSLYASLPILQEIAPEKKATRVLLLSLYSNILRECFEILALPYPDKM